MRCAARIGDHKTDGFSGVHVDLAGCETHGVIHVDRDASADHLRDAPWRSSVAAVSPWLCPVAAQSGWRSSHCQAAQLLAETAVPTTSTYTVAARGQWRGALRPSATTEMKKPSGTTMKLMPKYLSSIAPWCCCHEEVMRPSMRGFCPRVLIVQLREIWPEQNVKRGGASRRWAGATQAASSRFASIKKAPQGFHLAGL